MQTWVWILLGILVILLAILMLSLTIAVSYIDGELILTFRYGFLRIKLHPQKEKKKKEKKPSRIKKFLRLSKKKKPKQKDPKKQDIDSGLNKDDVNFKDTDKKNSKKANKRTKKEKKKLSYSPKEIYDFALEMLQGLSRPMKRIVKGIRISNLKLDFIIGGEDAFETALSYGRISGIVGYLIGLIQSLMTLRIKDVDIAADFDAKESTYNVKMLIKLRLGTFLIAAFSIFYKVLVNTIKMKNKDR